MAKLETEHVFNNTIADVFSGIRQFDKYTEYLQGVTGIEVLPPKLKGSLCQVKYDLNIIKNFYYTLDMFAEEPQKIWWTLDSSNLMKANNGSWEFFEIGPNQTKAIYTLDVKFKGLVPGKITDTVAKANLPAMFTGFANLINDHRK